MIYKINLLSYNNAKQTVSEYFPLHPKKYIYTLRMRCGAKENVHVIIGLLVSVNLFFFFNANIVSFLERPSLCQVLRTQGGS